MRVLTVVLLAAGGAAAVCADDLVLYFSKQGTTAGIPAEWPAGLTPTVPADRNVFLWAATEVTGATWDIWNGFSANVDHTVTAGVAYNPKQPDFEFIRWNPGSDLDFSDGAMFGVAIVEAGLGSGLDPLKVQEGAVHRHFLVAELVFPKLSTPYAVFLGSDLGFACKTCGFPQVWLGFGEPEPAPANLFPDLYVGFAAGDLSCDGKIDTFDIDPFVLALTDAAGYAVKYPDCDVTLADINGDGHVDAFDIDPFVKLLTGG